MTSLGEGCEVRGLRFLISSVWTLSTFEDGERFRIASRKITFNCICIKFKEALNPLRTASQ